MRTLALILHFVIGATFAGVLVTAAIIAGFHHPAILLGTGVLGMLLAIPASLLVARAMIAPNACADAENDIAIR
ncbi:CTP synthetase [Novosphingobium flavum]|uniref:CTP synthetase n=1 Tax=Novosphingobium aerophilum TaxID=2839843 RepID=UPI001639A6B9|nr:CTP synthetase [Novosphingobium aerophilum]MBC2662249.1 CTP synthetase [Novosphingobium aerophilum]